tara:strand:+ start:44 stop:526 length:483 start_codon:yes stop_codon:yes gene_type:complete
MASDFINIIERKLINQLRDDFPGCHVFGQYPDAVDISYPAIIVEISTSGLFDKFMGEKLSFDGQDKRGELVGLMYIIHLILDKDAQMTINSEVYKQRRLMNYLLLNVVNTFTDMTPTQFGSDVEVTYQDLSNWTDVGYDPEMELWGASAVYMLVFKNYRT